MKAARIFTRANPCTKIDLWNCFTDKAGQLVNRPVVDAKMEIGDNAPKYLIREKLVTFRVFDGIDWYMLTEKGKAWLRDGVLRYLEMHPERARECRCLPHGAKPTPAPVSRVIRRTKR